MRSVKSPRERRSSTSGKPRRAGRELAVILGLALAGFLLVSLFSYEPLHQSNAAGIAGARTAWFLAMLMGDAAFLLPFLLLYDLVWLLRTPPRGFGWSSVAAQGVLMAGVAAALALFLPGDHHAGGSAGQFISAALQRYFGSIGSDIIVAAAVLSAGVIGTNASLTRTLRALVVGGRWLGVAIGIALMLCLKIMTRGLLATGKGLAILTLAVMRGIRQIRWPNRLLQMLADLFEYQPLIRQGPRPLTLPSYPPHSNVDLPVSLPESRLLRKPAVESSIKTPRRNGANDTISPPQDAYEPRIAEKVRAADPHEFDIDRTPPPRGQGYELPPLSLLDDSPPPIEEERRDELVANSQLLDHKLRDFGIEGRVVQVLPGPVVTMYEYEPGSGVKVNRIASLTDDLALAMKALSVRIIAPVPGKSVVGIEIPNRKREAVMLKDNLASRAYQDAEGLLKIALGKDILGRPAWTDLARLPHLLIAGATGSGKSVGMNSIICSLLFRVTPQDVKLLLIDPKMLEFTLYDGLPHLLAPVITHPKKAAVALKWVVEEMERRYRLLSERGVRNIAGYNGLIEREERDRKGGSKKGATTSPTASHGHGEQGNGESEAESLVTTTAAGKLPYIVVVIDELADLMIVSSREVEESLARLAQMARASGVHLLVATQRPSVDVLTGLIKANFPSRISFQVSSRTDSRTILDANGAERLLGQGDMLFLPPGTSNLKRIHGAYISEKEINRLVAFWKDQQRPEYHDLALNAPVDTPDGSEDEYDEKYDDAVALVARTGQASISMLQRRLRVGYNRAARMIEVMERDGLVGPSDGSKARDVYARADFDDNAL